MLTNRTAWLGIAIAALTIAGFFLARNFWRDGDSDPPGIIFERADRPAKV